MAIKIAIYGGRMDKTFSIAQTRDNLAALLKTLRRESVIRITRRGKPIAVLLSVEDYDRLTSGKSGFWSAYTRYLQHVDLAALGIGPDVFEAVRDASPGRVVDV
jgi:prevent-host-death family protein